MLHINILSLSNNYFFFFSELDIGIYLVRKAKKSLKEIEHIMDSSESSMEIEE